MKHFTHPRFWELYDELPVETRRLADKTLNFSNTIPNTPLYISSAWDAYGLFG
jgi:hypothetical protein